MYYLRDKCDIRCSMIMIIVLSVQIEYKFVTNIILWISYFTNGGKNHCKMKVILSADLTMNGDNYAVMVFFIGNLSSKFNFFRLVRRIATLKQWLLEMLYFIEGPHKGGGSRLNNSAIGGSLARISIPIIVFPRLSC